MTATATATALTGLEKIALLLKSLPRETMDKVMRNLDPRHSKLVLAELAKLNQKGDLNDKISGVLMEAVSILAETTSPKREPSTPKGDAQAKAAVVAPSPSTAPANLPTNNQVDIRIADKPMNKPPSASVPLPASESASSQGGFDANLDPLQALAAMPPELLASALDCENARTTSLLMNSLDIEVASQIYKRLSPAKRKEVSLRFTEQSTVGETLIKRIAQGVLKKCQTLRAAAASSPIDQEGREKRMAALLRGLERAERMEMLTALEESDAELTGRIKAMLYQFEDILRMENISVQKLLSEVDVKTLCQALRGAPQEIEDKILANLSKRAQVSLKEEISLTGIVQAPLVRSARQTMVEAIQRLDQRGELIING